MHTNYGFTHYIEDIESNVFLVYVVDFDNTVEDFYIVEMKVQILESGLDIYNILDNTVIDVLEHECLTHFKKQVKENV